MMEEPAVAQLAAALQEAGGSLPEADHEPLADAVRAVRDMCATLFAVTAARHEEPAALFSARVHGHRS